MTRGEGPRRRDPWRVEGVAGAPAGATDRRTRRGPWGWLLALLVINWIVASAVLAPPSRTTVSYTFFTAQLRAGNVATVTATAETIQGAFTKPVAYPPGTPGAAQAGPFTTQRPEFATDDLYGTLAAQGVTVNAEPPDAPAPLWQRVVVGFGPTLLLVGLLVWLQRRAAAGGGLGGFGRSRATLYRPDAGPPPTTSRATPCSACSRRAGTRCAG